MKHYLSVAGLGLLVTTVSLQGAPIGAGSQQGRDYIIEDSSLSGWSVGVDARQRTRDITFTPGSFTSEVDETRIVGYLGYDVLWDWLTIYGLGGLMSTEVGERDDADNSVLGVALHANLLSHLMQTPGDQLDWIRLTGSMEYSTTSITRGGEDLDYDQFEATLLLALVNEINNNSAYTPDAIALIGGPIYANVLGDDAEVDSGDRWGYTVGIDFLLSSRLSFNLRVEGFSDIGVGTGFYYRF